MIQIEIRGHPPWYARGTPVINLRDGPIHKTRGKPLVNWRDGPTYKIRGKPPFVNNEAPNARGKPRDKIRHWQALKTVIFSRKKQPVRPMICLFVKEECRKNME